MNLGTHGTAVQGYIALHNGTYQNLELLMKRKVCLSVEHFFWTRNKNLAHKMIWYFTHKICIVFQIS